MKINIWNLNKAISKLIKRTFAKNIKKIVDMYPNTIASPEYVLAASIRSLKVIWPNKHLKKSQINSLHLGISLNDYINYQFTYRDKRILEYKFFDFKT